MRRPRAPTLRCSASRAISLAASSVQVTFTDDAARAIAREALHRKVGARGLRMILEELMLDLMYHIPGNKKVKELVITEAMVQKRELTLPVMLEKAG